MYYDVKKDGKIHIKNKLGECTLRCVSDPRHVSDGWAKDAPVETFIDFPTAERFTVVSENHHVQIAIPCNMPIKEAMKQCVIFVHSSASHGSWAVLEHLVCNVPDAKQYIEDWNRSHPVSDADLAMMTAHSRSARTATPTQHV